MIRIKELRNSRRITQQALARAVGVKQQTLNKYELGISDVRLSTLIRIADYFHTSLDYLAGRSEPITSEQFIVCENNLALCSLTEAYLLHLFRQMPSKHQEGLIDFLSFMDNLPIKK